MTRFYDLATNEVQEDQFQLPSQQHQAAALLSDNPSKIRSVKEKKKKKIQRKPDDDGDDDGDDNYNDVDNDTSKSGVNDDNDESNETDERAKIRANELNSIIEDTENLDGPYWANSTLGSKTDLYMLSAIATYNNIDGLHGLRSTPQYGLNRGMKEFGQAKATQQYLSLVTILLEWTQ